MASGSGCGVGSNAGLGTGKVDSGREGECGIVNFVVGSEGGILASFSTSTVARREEWPSRRDTSTDPEAGVAAAGAVAGVGSRAWASSPTCCCSPSSSLS